MFASTNEFFYRMDFYVFFLCKFETFLRMMMNKSYHAWGRGITQSSPCLALITIYNGEDSVYQIVSAAPVPPVLVVSRNSRTKYAIRVARGPPAGRGPTFHIGPCGRTKKFAGPTGRKAGQDSPR